MTNSHTGHVTRFHNGWFESQSAGIGVSSNFECGGTPEVS